MRLPLLLPTFRLSSILQVSFFTTSRASLSAIFISPTPELSQPHACDPSRSRDYALQRKVGGNQTISTPPIIRPPSIHPLTPPKSKRPTTVLCRC
ncbi:uncharacterized protein BDZ83DRAFT_346083 [Colletotrichum acutatum]|uniref:Uncharacterized protein n=1 Tax=Glomerella acutata TaxID=27357 RepID=A0AAD8UNH9_GLOAC|nr:uncharacterized protein BDZ83DRAFT_346083 [Colletotrichum acutatum]KAK1724556.1 hypothetical protein BDZ83DRAFT_346083 [Colletotrichum acutatum]